MKVNIKTNVGRGSDPNPTIAHYIRARWGKNEIILIGTATCQGRRWNTEHVYYFENFLKKTKEEILKNLFDIP